MLTGHHCCYHGRFGTEDAVCRCEECPDHPIAFPMPTTEERIEAYNLMAAHAEAPADELRVRAEYLGELRKSVIDSLDEGCNCLVCGQRCVIQGRNLYATLVYYLGVLERKTAPDYDFAHFANLVKPPGGDYALPKHWGLLEHETGVRPDGSGRNGFWRITEKGRAFIDGKITLPYKAMVFDDRCYRFEGKEITVFEALDKHYDYREMRGWTREED